MAQGMALPSISGYHDITMRTIMSRLASDSAGLSTSTSDPAACESSPADSSAIS